MEKKYFLKENSYNNWLDCKEGVFAAKKDNNYMFKLLDVKNYIGPGLSYDVWCKLMGCKLQKIMFPYKLLDSYKKQSHVGALGY